MNTYLYSHQQAKKLNNTAALCIETGHYKRGISCLVEALQLSDKQNIPQHLFFKPNDMVTSAVCQCKHCSLDECIVFSERTPLNSITGNVNTVDEPIDHTSNHGYIHRRPIRITPQSSQEGHNMGVTLSLIITFNLALAHHLSALSTFSIDQHDDNCIHKNHVLDSSLLLRKSTTCKETFQKILYLYELAYRWQIELDESRILKLRQVQQQQQDMGRSSWNFDNTTVEMDASPVSSLRFNMIICNNLSQIHQLVQNHSKSRRCLEHLLATIMFVVASDGTQQHWRGYSLPSPSLSSSNTNLQTSAISPTTNTQRQQQQQHEYMDLDGFLLNVTQGILQGPCAGAA